MPRITHQRRAGLTPGKLGVIAVLSLVLVGVLFQQSGRRPAASPLKKRDSGQRSAVAVEAAKGGAPGSAAASERGSRKRWGEIPLGAAVAHDPFSLPAELLPAPRAVEPAPEPAETVAVAEEQDARREFEQRRRTALSGMQEKGVSMVLASGRGAVALVGSRELRVGDLVDGLRVIEIGPRGVVLVEEDER